MSSYWVRLVLVLHQFVYWARKIELIFNAFVHNLFHIGCCVFFLWQSGDQKKKGCNSYKGYFLEKMAQCSHISSKKSEIACSGILPKYSGVPQKNLLSSLNYSQIWLSTLVDDHLTKLEEKKP
jgi:hypothetical protein